MGVVKSRKRNSKFVRLGLPLNFVRTRPFYHFILILICFTKSYNIPKGILRLQKQPLEVFVKKRCSKKFRKISGKHLCQSLFFRPATLLNKRLWYRRFPANFTFLRTPVSQNTSGRLLLKISRDALATFC